MTENHIKRAKLLNLAPGDVLVVSGRSWAAFFIRLRALFTGEPSMPSHVAVVHHMDDSGTVWAIEGRPSGVGWIDASRYLDNPFTKTNAGVQLERTTEQRAMVAKILEQMLGTSYDWYAIAALGMEPIIRKLAILWKTKNWGEKTVPAHIICSALADWAYSKVGWQSPGQHDSRFITPGDWYDFISRLEMEGA